MKSPSHEWIARLLPSRVETAAVCLHIRNVTRQTEIGDSIELAGNSSRRNKGLLGRTGLADGEGLWIVPCEAVHTFFMKFAIDLIYLDRRHRVVKIRQAVGPGRISASLRAHSVVELPVGSIARTQTQRGDTLEIERLPQEVQEWRGDHGC